MQYEFQQKTVKKVAIPSASAELDANVSTDNEATNKLANDNTQKVNEHQSMPSKKQVEKNSSSGGFFSCFRGTKVADSNEEDAYERRTGNEMVSF